MVAKPASPAPEEAKNLPEPSPEDLGDAPEIDIDEEFEDRRPSGITKVRTEIAELLKATLSRRNVKSREGRGRTKLDYIEGWWAISEANRIFGFDRWWRETIYMQKEDAHQYTNTNNNKQLWSVCYTAKVRVTVIIDGITTIREGTGYGSGNDSDLGAAIEGAVKEAETDAMKRALMTFGDPFGLALYDKQQSNVTNDRPSTPPPALNPNAKNQPVKKGQAAQQPVKKGQQGPPAPRQSQSAPNTPQRKDFAKELIACGLNSHGINTLLKIVQADDIGKIPPARQEKILSALGKPGAVENYNLGQNSRGEVILPLATSVIDAMEAELNALFEGGGEVLPE